MRWPLKRPLSLARPTNGPPPTPAPLITEYIKQGLTTIHPQTLAASTSAIASSLALPPCDPTDTAPDELGSSQGSYLGTAYEAVKFAVDIANASSDSFLPLKAVVGALSVLMKNYDVRFPRAACSIGCQSFLTANSRQRRPDERARGKGTVAR